MYIGYVDESGDTGALPSANADIQPVLVLVCLLLPQQSIAAVTQQFVRLKRRFHPKRYSGLQYPIDAIQGEIKGASVREMIRSGSRRKRRHAIGFLDKVLRLVEHADGRLVGRVWIKGIGQGFDGRAVYTFSMQAICRSFESFLNARNEQGLVVADGRSHAQNRRVSHSIFTQKFKISGDEYPRILEMPTYGDSKNHAGLQIADLISGGMLFPMATYSYCLGHVNNVHVHADFRYVKDYLGSRIEGLQYRYDQDQRMHGGITVSDSIGGRSGSRLFRQTAMPPQPRVLGPSQP